MFLWVLSLLLVAVARKAECLDCTAYGRNCYPLSKTHGLLPYAEGREICISNGYDGLLTVPQTVADKTAFDPFYDMLSAVTRGEKTWLSHTLQDDTVSGQARAFESDFDCGVTPRALFANGRPDGSNLQDTCLLLTEAGLDDVHCLTQAYAICERIIAYSQAQSVRPRNPKTFALVGYGSHWDRKGVCGGKPIGTDIHHIACGTNGGSAPYKQLVADANITDIPSAVIWANFEYNYTSNVWTMPRFRFDLDCDGTFNFSYDLPPGDPTAPEKTVVYNVLKDKFELKDRSDIGLVTCQTTLADLSAAATTQAPPACNVPTTRPARTTVPKLPSPPASRFTLKNCDATCIAVRVIQDIGCLYLIGLMAFTIAVFLIIKERHFERYLHMCQELTLMCGHIAIITLRDKFYVKSLCLAGSIIIHYFLSSFLWFLAIEAWHNMTLLSNVVSTQAWPGAKILIPLGFLGPIVFVGALAAGWHGEHPGTNTCWVNFDHKAIPMGMIIPGTFVLWLGFVFWEASEVSYRLPCVPKLKYYVALSNRLHWPFVALLAVAAWMLGSAAVYGYAVVTYVAVMGLNVALGTVVAYAHIVGSRPAVELVIKMWKKLTSCFRQKQESEELLRAENGGNGKRIANAKASATLQRVIA